MTGESLHVVLRHNRPYPCGYGIRFHCSTIECRKQNDGDIERNMTFSKTPFRFRFIMGIE